MGKPFLFLSVFLISSVVHAAGAPDIGANALMLYRNSNRGNGEFDNPRNGFGLDEVELQFSADVDPTARLNLILGVHQEVEVDTTATPPTRTAEWHAEPEEAFMETLSLPLVTLKFGRFKTAFGKHNQIHKHASPFIDAPLAQQALLGDEGFADDGVSAAFLLPTSWFSEFTAQAVSGKTEGVDSYYGAPSPNAAVGIARFRNLWDLSEASTLELGLSAANGKNADDLATDLSGVDFTFKWRPVAGGRERSLTWTTEAIRRKRALAATGGDEVGLGGSTFVQYQFAPRWWIQARTEYLEMKDQDPAGAVLPAVQHRHGLLVGFMPTEFSGYRLEYDRLEDGAAEPEHRLLIQFNYSIGAHPAHAY